MYAFDEKFTKAYQQELVRIATSEYDVQDDPNLPQSLYQTVKRVSSGVRQKENGVIPRLICGLRFDFVFKSRFLSAFFR
jgi:hypothetical protein